MKTDLLMICLACLLTGACHSARVDSSTANAPPHLVTSEPAYKPGPQPTDAEVREVIKRNYEDAVSVDDSRPVLVGDFNGDNSEDVAVVVKPSQGKAAELNGEYVNWILEDPRQVQPTPQKVAQRPIHGNDLLLAVIHGHDREGWRNRLARQTYLLQNSVGNEFERQTGRELSKDNRALPSLRGDVIRETLNGTAGIIYWTGARYAWHPVS